MRQSRTLYPGLWYPECTFGHNGFFCWCEEPSVAIFFTKHDVYYFFVLFWGEITFDFCSLAKIEEHKSNTNKKKQFSSFKHRQICVSSRLATSRYDKKRSKYSTEKQRKSSQGSSGKFLESLFTYIHSRLVLCVSQVDCFS